MIFPFEREAEQGAPMPDGLSLPDQLAFRFLSSMYASIRAGSITRERAISDKGKMTYQYNIANESMKQWKELGQHWSNIIKYAEFAQTQYGWCKCAMGTQSCIWITQAPFHAG